MDIPYILVVVVHVIVSLLLRVSSRAGVAADDKTLGGAAAHVFGGDEHVMSDHRRGDALHGHLCDPHAVHPAGTPVIERLPMSLPAATDAIPLLPGVAPTPNASRPSTVRTSDPRSVTEDARSSLRWERVRGCPRGPSPNLLS